MNRHVRLIAAEGLHSLATRVRERLREAARMRVAHARGRLTSAMPHCGLLNYVAMPAVRRLGGVPTLLRNRLEEERHERSVALLAPGSGMGELWTASPAWCMRRVAFPGGGDALVDPRLCRAIGEACALTGAKAIHVETGHDVPFESLLNLAGGGLALVLTLSDYALWCVRPNLLEEPVGEFCNFSRDDARCARCLGYDRDPALVELSRRRELARRLLQRATAVVFPSEVVRHNHERELGLPRGVVRVIEPGVPGPLHERPSRSRRQRVALVGAVKRHKGAHLLPELVRRSGSECGIAWHVFGGGDASLLETLRPLPGVTVHGYYESDELPRLLARHRIDAALLLSIGPESYGLTLSECWQAGVPVVAFDIGAIGERIRREGGGWLVPLEEGTAGVARVLHDWREGGAVPETPRRINSARDTAQAHLELYRELGIV